MKNRGILDIQWILDSDSKLSGTKKIYAKVAVCMKDREKHLIWISYDDCRKTEYLI